MISRKLMIPVVVATAVGAPYLLLEKNWPSAAKESVDKVLSTITSDSSVSPGFPSEYTFGTKAAQLRGDLDRTFTGPPVGDLGEVLRFDITPQWIAQRWPRVTTVAAETGLEGLRVPLMTGTRLDDLAGTLTYYFDPHRQLQRLAFDGFTGDERRLVMLVTQYYGLQAEPSLDAGTYIARWNACPTSVLQVQRAPIMTAESPHAQLHIRLELNRPNIYYGLSPESLALLDRSRATYRW